MDLFQKDGEKWEQIHLASPRSPSSQVGSPTFLRMGSNNSLAVTGGIG
jgi:hypothetical protein